ncbi:hypothetical protein CP981_16615 [Streptomyces platensis]|uniref:Uncharacterized protein n=1 Tax=Streptomyces platensis TaxID=58346 RepID=A0AAE6TMU1_STRPT|nr:hypothetical protein [Streptomyces platensis]OSY44478.1 hypothetical protein BG653_04081 [Streptomyces platensis]QEV53072.1 hypothetical protein CP981_16615 [Streptomyces platensis]
MSTPTLSALNAPLLLLRMFSAEYPHLPAPCLEVSTVYPDLLTLSFHDDLAGFEAWRDALGIAVESVSHHVQGDGRTRVLEARADYAGARLHLVGYTKIPAPGEVRSRAEVDS